MTLESMQRLVLALAALRKLNLSWLVRAGQAEVQFI